MPKRRITTAKQKAASRRNGKQHKGNPRGKSLLLYHRTSEANAVSILKSQQFDGSKAVRGKGTRSVVDAKTFFSTDHRTNANYGPAILKAVVPYKVRGKLNIYPDRNFDRESGYKYVDSKALRGIKIRRQL